MLRLDAQVLLHHGGVVLAGIAEDGIFRGQVRSHFGVLSTSRLRIARTTLADTASSRQIMICGQDLTLPVARSSALYSAEDEPEAHYMARAVSEIEQEIRALPDTEKERLLRALLEELDGPPDPDVELAWLDEIQRRSRDLDAGLVKTIPADTVFAEIRAKLARR